MYLDGWIFAYYPFFSKHSVMQQPSTLSQPTTSSTNPVKNARDQIDNLYQLSVLLGAGLDKQSLGICVSLLESGVNPEALACIMKELKKEAASVPPSAPAAESGLSK